MRRRMGGLLALAWFAAAAPGLAQMEIPPPWREAMKRVYRLDEGEVVRRIPPPFIPERDAYFRSILLSPLSVGRSAVSLILEQRGPRLELRGFVENYSGNPTPQSVSLMGAILQLTEMRRVDLAGDEELLNLPAAGDWVRREGATPEDILKALGEVISADRPRPIRIVHRPYPRRAIVMRGRFQLRPLRDREEENAVHVYLDALDDHPSSGPILELADSIPYLEVFLRHPIVDEALDAGERIEWIIHDSSALITERPRTESRLEKVLENLSRQTSLDFTIETRIVMTWVVEEKEDKR